MRANDGGRFTDLFDLAKRVDAKQVNRRVFEALVKCGALDALPGNRAQKLAALDAARRPGRARDARSGARADVALRRGADARAVARAETADRPGAEHARTAGVGEGDARDLRLGPSAGGGRSALLRAAGATPVKDLRAWNDEVPVTVAGIVAGVRRTLTKAGAANSHRADRGHDRRLRRRRVLEDLSAGAAALPATTRLDRQRTAAAARAARRRARRRAAGRTHGQRRRGDVRSSRPARRGAAACRRAAGTCKWKTASRSTGWRR